MKQAAGSLQSGRCEGNERKGWIGVGNGRCGLLERGIHGDSIVLLLLWWVYLQTPVKRENAEEDFLCVV